MAHPTVEAPTVKVPDAPPPSTPRRAWHESGLETARAHPWRLAAVGLLALATLIVLWAGTRPGYDPYGWLVWGKLTIHWKLDTNGAPSWKPLPFLFTVPFSLVGHYAVWLWMIFSVAVSLSGPIFAWRIAFRLTGADPGRRYAAYAAGAVALLAVLGIRDYTHFILSAQSDTMIVTTCLAAIDCFQTGRYRWSFALWVLGSLGRPEVWPFLGAYSLWAWFRLPQLRRVIIGGLLLIPLLWFGIPALTAKSAFIAGDNALHSPRELRNNKFFGTIGRFLKLHEWQVQVAAALAVLLALLGIARAPAVSPDPGAVGARASGDGRLNRLRSSGIGALLARGRWEDRQVLLLAAGTVVWVLIEAAFALHGWPAVPRYLFEAVATMAVLAGVAVGRVILVLPGRLRAASPRFSPALVGWATGLLVLVWGGTMLPAAKARYSIERKDLSHERVRAREINRLSTVVGLLGGSQRILACGQPDVRIGYQSQLAWYMGEKIGIFYVNPAYQRLHPHPLVHFQPLADGWRVRAIIPRGTPAALTASCRHLHLTLHRP